MALTKSAKAYEPPNQKRKSPERWGEVDTMNVGNFATSAPPGNETLRIFVPRSHPSPGLRHYSTRLHPFLLAISFAPARGICHLATALQQKEKAKMKSGS